MKVNVRKEVHKQSSYDLFVLYNTCTANVVLFYIFIELEENLDKVQKYSDLKIWRI